MTTGRRSLGGLLVLSAVAVFVVLAAVALEEASAQLCPLCECPVAYQLVCGKTTDKNGKVKMRGFPSRCVMECNNQCRKAQYEFVKRGRCGAKVPKPQRNEGHNSAADKGPAINATTAPPNLKGMLSVPPE